MKKPLPLFLLSASLVASMTSFAQRGENFDYRKDGQQMSNAGRGQQQQPRPQQQPQQRQQPQQQPQQQQALQGIPVEKIENYANQQARTVANRIVRTYGLAERWRYNFSIGFWNTLLNYQNNPSAYSEYSRQADAAAPAGAAKGQHDGAAKAHQDAHPEGSRMATARFVEIVDKGTSPNLDLPSDRVNFGGLNGPMGEPNMEDALAQLNPRLLQAMTILSFADDGFSVTYNMWTGRHNWDLVALYRGGRFSDFEKFNFLDSWFRGDYAYSEWKENGLGGRYDHNLYNKMDYSERAHFESVFKNVYNGVIDSKIRDVVMQLEPGAIALGTSIGNDAGREYVARKGYADGYNSGYTQGSRKGYNEQYNPSLQRGFLDRADFLTKNAELHDIAATLTAASGAFSPGAVVGAEVTGMKNIGRVAAQLSSASLQGNGLKNGTEKQIDISIAPSSSMKERVAIESLATISEAAPTDQRVTVRLNLGPVSTNVSFAIGFNDTVKQYKAMLDEGKDGSAMRAYIIKEIRAELTSAVAAKQKDLYKGNGSRLQKLVDLLRGSKAGADLKAPLMAITNEAKISKMWLTAARTIRQGYEEKVNQL